MAGWTSAFSRFFWRKDSQGRIAITIHQAHKPVFTPANYEKLAKEGFNKNVIAYRAISSLAMNAGSVSWNLFKKTSSDRIEIESHPILDLLHKPNPMMGGSFLTESIFAFFLMAGNAYVEAVGPSPQRAPLELWPLAPDKMKVVPGTHGMPEAFVYGTGESKKTFPVDQVSNRSMILHFKSFNPIDPWYGLSALQAAAMQIDLHNESSRFNLSLLENGAVPSGALVATVTDSNPGGKIDDQQFNRLKRELQQVYQGARNAGEPMILEGGLDWKSFSFTPEAMQLIESKFSSAREIALALGYPPQLLSIPGDNTYSNYKEARLALWEETILPRLDHLCADLNNWLVPMFGDGLVLEYDKDDIDALEPKRQAVWDKVSNASFLTVNEKRIAVGYDSVDGGDVVLVAGESVPLQSLGSQDQGDSGSNDDSDSGSEDDAEPSGDDGKSFLDIELKVVDLKNEAERTAEWRKAERLRGGFRNRMRKQVSALLTVEGMHAAAAAKGLPPHQAQQAAINVIEKNTPNWDTLYRHNLASVGTAFGTRVMRALKQDRSQLETKDNIRFNDYLKNWIDQYLGRKITQIQSTTKDMVVGAIQNAVQDAMDNGDTLNDVSKSIQDAYSGFTPYRAATIARTEVHAASNAAAQGAAKATGIGGLGKEWISSNDARSRDGAPESTNHRAMDGVVVNIDDKFQVPSEDGPDSMDGPGDQSAPADQVINCRCTIAFTRNGSGNDNQ